MKRYQVYLNPHSVSIFDEVAEVTKLSRSKLLQEAIDAAATRVGNLLAAIKPPKSNDYSWFDSMIGSIKLKGKGNVNISENVDEIYYR